MLKVKLRKYNDSHTTKYDFDDDHVKAFPKLKNDVLILFWLI